MGQLTYSHGTQPVTQEEPAKSEKELLPEPASEGSRERWLAATGLAAFAAILAFRMLGDFDLGWHLATGRAIVQSHHIPTIDPLAFTHGPLTYVETVSDTAFYLIWRVGGAMGLQIAGALIALGLGAFVWLQTRRFGPISFAVTALTVAAIRPWLVVRAATISFLFIAIQLWLFDIHRRDPTGKSGRRALYATLALITVWANTHGFASMGGMLAVCYFGYRLTAGAASALKLARLSSLLPPEDGRDTLVSAIMIVLALGAASLNVTSLGFRLGYNPLAAKSELDFVASITEFARPTLDFFVSQESLGPVVAALAIAALIIGRESREAPRRMPSLFEIGMTLGGCLTMAAFVRTIPVGVLFVAPVIARRFGAFIPATCVSRFGLAMSLWLTVAHTALRQGEFMGVGFDPRHFPEQQVAWIKKHDLHGHMWNFSPIGGYLALRMPEHPIFMDGRNTYARDFGLVERAYRSTTDPKTFRALAQEFDMQFAVVSAIEGENVGAPLALLPDWTMVHMDGTAAVYVRRPGPNAALAADGYRVLRHLTPPEAAFELAIQGGRRAADLAHDGLLALEQAPTDPRAAFFAGCGALAIRDTEALERALTVLRVVAPSHPAIAVLTNASNELTP